jgi:hypothetical protein
VVVGDKSTGHYVDRVGRADNTEAFASSIGQIQSTVT